MSGHPNCAVHAHKLGSDEWARNLWSIDVPKQEQCVGAQNAVHRCFLARAVTGGAQDIGARSGVSGHTRACSMACTESTWHALRARACSMACTERV